MWTHYCTGKKNLHNFGDFDGGVWGLENQKSGVQGLIFILYNIQYYDYVSFVEVRSRDNVEWMQGLEQVDISAHIGFERRGGDSV
jgi:hypothetical protein